MNIQDTGSWPGFARERLQVAPQAKKIAGIYTGITLGLSLVTLVLSVLLDAAIDQTSGLGQMGKRSLLQTVQTILPIGQTAVQMCLDLGFTAAMLRVSRGQYVSPNTLRAGAERFWVLLRAELLIVAACMLVAIPAAYLAVGVYMVTPLGDSLAEALVPLLTSGTISEDAYAQAMSAMMPCIVVCGLVATVAVVVVSYRYRMVDYILIDKPGTKALAALRESRKMMKGNCWKLLKLDLRLWWYHAALVLATLAGDVDVLLSYLGVELPWSADVSYYLAFGLSLLLMGLVYFFLRGRAEVVYGFAYDAIKPPEQKNEGVVLGSIFS